MDINTVKEQVARFAADREWDQFHTPKNLASALTVEAAELLEVFQWLTGEESQALSEKQLEAVKEEVADIFIYLLRIADVLDIDIATAVSHKLTINAIKYPVDLSRGNATKYNQR